MGRTVEGGTQTLTSSWDREPLTVDAKVPTQWLDYYLGGVHVGTSTLEVCREVWRRIKKAEKRNPDGWTRELRKQTLAAAIWIHAENLACYLRVMSGRF